MLSIRNADISRGGTTLKKMSLWQFGALIAVLALISPGTIFADVSKQTKDSLDKLLLGKEVKPLVELPATKEGLDVYIVPPHGKRVDDRGLDLGEMSKELKSKGVGVEAQQWETITDVKVDGDHVEIHLGGGGEGRRGANHANKVGAGYLRAGGSRVNFRYHDECDGPRTYSGRVSQLHVTSSRRQQSFNRKYQQKPSQRKSGQRSRRKRWSKE